MSGTGRRAEEAILVGNAAVKVEPSVSGILSIRSMWLALLLQMVCPKH